MGTTPGSLIKFVVEWYQLSAGTQQSILQDTSPIDYVYCPWVAALRKFMHSTGTTMHIPQLWLPARQQENDECIMDLLRSKPYLSLSTINAG